MAIDISSECVIGFAGIRTLCLAIPSTITGSVRSARLVAPVVRFQVMQENPGRGYNRVMRQIAKILPLPATSRLERSRPRGGRCAWPCSSKPVELEYCRVIGGPYDPFTKNDAGGTPASQLLSEYNNHLHPYRRRFRTVLQASAGRVGPGAHSRVSGAAFQQAKTEAQHGDATAGGLALLLR